MNVWHFHNRKLKYQFWEIPFDETNVPPIICLQCESMFSVWGFHEKCVFAVDVAGTSKTGLSIKTYYILTLMLRWES